MRIRSNADIVEWTRYDPTGLTIDVFSWQCPGCRDYKDAVRAGHFVCLWRLGEKEEYLNFNVYARKWVLAGEARQAQPWEAAALACKNEHSLMLQFILMAIRPTTLEYDTVRLPLYSFADVGLPWPTTAKIVPWHMRGNLYNSRSLRNWLTGEPEDIILDIEYALYFHAVQGHTTDCLEVLLNEGCRSPWLCAIAAALGKPDRLKMAARRKCPCDWRMLEIAALSGRLDTLEAVYEVGSDTYQPGFMFFSLRARWANVPRHKIAGLMESVVALGHAECLGALLGWFGYEASDVLVLLYFQRRSPATIAAASGHLNCLHLLQRFAPVLV
jgi:hypothetical protein